MKGVYLVVHMNRCNGMEGIFGIYQYRYNADVACNRFDKTLLEDDVYCFGEDARTNRHDWAEVQYKDLKDGDDTINKENINEKSKEEAQ